MFSKLLGHRIVFSHSFPEFEIENSKQNSYAIVSQTVIVSSNARILITDSYADIAYGNNA